ncbi:hypothetical protein AB1N83_014159 [Pleurotus pulmonarius]
MDNAPPAFPLHRSWNLPLADTIALPPSSSSHQLYPVPHPAARVPYPEGRASHWRVTWRARITFAPRSSIQLECLAISPFFLRIPTCEMLPITLRRLYINQICGRMFSRCIIPSQF